MIVNEKVVFVDLGMQDEKKVTNIPIDFSPWAEEFGEGAIEVVYDPPGNADAYTVFLDVEGHVATWNVKKTDLQTAGRGEMQVLYYVGDKLKRSVVWPTNVSRSLNSTGPAPDPYESWLESLQEMAAETLVNANTATAKAGEAAESAETAKESELEAQQSATEASASAQAAAQSEANAKASEDSARESADKAEQSAAQSGYMFFYIDEDGWLHYVRTDNVQVDFYIGNDGYLYVEA